MVGLQGRRLFGFNNWAIPNESLHVATLQCQAQCRLTSGQPCSQMLARALLAYRLKGALAHQEELGARILGHEKTIRPLRRLPEPCCHEGTKDTRAISVPGPETHIP